MERKKKTITKEWDFDPPYHEDVEEYIKKIITSCDNMKKDYPKFLTYIFTIDSSTKYKCGNPITDQKIKMVCTRWETDAEIETRNKQSVAAKKTAKKRKEQKIEMEKEQLKKLIEKYPKEV